VKSDGAALDAARAASKPESAAKFHASPPLRGSSWLGGWSSGFSTGLLACGSVAARNHADAISSKIGVVSSTAERSFHQPEPPASPAGVNNPRAGSPGRGPGIFPPGERRGSAPCSLSSTSGGFGSGDGVSPLLMTPLVCTFARPFTGAPFACPFNENGTSRLVPFCTGFTRGVSL
jgi:hypothetical protein